MGPIHITGPVWSTISQRAVFVAALAFVLVFRYKLSVLRVLGHRRGARRAGRHSPLEQNGVFVLCERLGGRKSVIG